jgi:hypothetical protein
MRNFRHLSGLTNEEWASLSRKEAPTVTTGIVDPASFETFETVANAAATARMIVKAAKTRAAGGPPAPKPSTVAQQILDAGAKRRAGGY